MNYLKIYKQIISKAKKQRSYRNISQINGDYFEEHHIIPKSCGGSNHSYNKILLTAREHFIAHRLLVKISEKIYGRRHSYTYKMDRAIRCFLYTNKDKRKYIIFSRTYEYIKKRYSESSKGHFVKKETRKKISLALKGNTNGKGNRTKEFCENLKSLKSKNYKLSFKDGKTLEICNLNQFSKNNNYSHGNLFEMLRGRRKRHKDIVKIELINDR